MLNIREALILSAISEGDGTHPEDLRRKMKLWGVAMPMGSTSKTLQRMIEKGLLRRSGYRGWHSYTHGPKARRALIDFRKVAAHAMGNKATR